MFHVGIVAFRVIALHILFKFMSIKRLLTFGICIGKGYHDDIKNINFESAKEGIYKDIFLKHYKNIYSKNAIGEKATWCKGKYRDVYSSEKQVRMKKATNTSSKIKR